jgi:hypothetical protein
MALLAVTPITKAGIDTAGVAADVAGDTFPNTGKEVLIVKNGSASPITVTLDIKATLDGQAVTDPTVTINAGIEKIIGPFPLGYYNDANGRVSVTYSAVTTVTVKALSLAPAS